MKESIRRSGHEKYNFSVKPFPDPVILQIYIHPQPSYIVTISDSHRQCVVTFRQIPVELNRGILERMSFPALARLESFYPVSVEQLNNLANAGI
mgnify:CR=1 FL=1